MLHSVISCVFFSHDCNFVVSCTALPQFLLYAARQYIRRITLGDHVETTIPLGSGLRNAIALDYDYNHNCIYWADISLDTIKRSFLNGSGMFMYQINVLLSVTAVK